MLGCETVCEILRSEVVRESQILRCFLIDSKMSIFQNEQDGNMIEAAVTISLERSYQI